MEDQTYLLDRDKYQSLFVNALIENGAFSEDGYPVHPAILANTSFIKNGGSETILKGKDATYLIRTEAWDEDSPFADRPKFEVWEDGEEVIVFDWYKYPIRNGTVNKNLSYLEIATILCDFMYETKWAILAWENEKKVGK